MLHGILNDLDQQIRDRFGSRLLIRHGDPAVEVPAMAAAFDASTVYVSRDYAPYGRQRDTLVAAALAEQGRSLTGVGSPYAVDPGRVLKGDGTPYKVFTPFSKIWRQTGVEPPAPDPGDDMDWAPTSALDEYCHPLFDPPEPGCGLPSVGETAALDRWASFLDAASAADGTMRSGVSAYNDLRDQPALAGTSQLSPDLKWGTIHPRTLLADLDLSGPKDDGAMVFSSELAWRDFYADVLFTQPHTAWKNLNSRFDAMPVDTDIIIPTSPTTNLGENSPQASRIPENTPSKTLSKLSYAAIIRLRVGDEIHDIQKAFNTHHAFPKTTRQWGETLR